MLEYKQKGKLSPSDRVKILNNIELLWQSEFSQPIGKMPVGFNKLVVGIDGFFVFFIPLARHGLPFGRVERWKTPPQCFYQELGKVDARFFRSRNRFGVKFYGDTFAHKFIPSARRRADNRPNRAA